MSRFGFIESIVIDQRTDFLISGHGRTRTLSDQRDRGESPPDGILADGDGDWLVPVTVGWSSSSDTEAAGALIALNRTGEVGGWVDASLLSLIDGLTESEAGLAGIGFDDADRDRLRAYLATLDMADNFTDDLTPSTGYQYQEGTVGVTVIVQAEHKQDLYRMLAGVDWVVDASDKGKS